MIKNALAETDAAIALIRKGMQLNPFYTWDYPYNLGRAYYTAGKLETAIAFLEEARTRNPNALPVRIHLAASYAGVGRLEDAEWEMEEVKALSPNESITLLKATHPVKARSGHAASSTGSAHSRLARVRRLNGSGAVNLA